MVAMTKYEMVRYLRDYANLQYLIMNNPDESIRLLFDRYMKSNGRFEDDTREYYDRMRKVYTIYNLMKRFSYLEDFLLNRDNFITDNDLDEIIPDNTYSTDMGSISKKKILQFIRDTFSHNNSVKVDRFKISPSVRSIEIEWLDRPIRIKFGVKNLVDIYNNMAKHKQNILDISFSIPDDFNINSENLFDELSKIKFVHYYFTNKLPYSIIDQLIATADTKGLSFEELSLRSEMFNTLSSSIGPSSEFPLTDEQKEKLVSYIERYRKQFPEDLKVNSKNVMYYFLEKVTPVPLLKDRVIKNQELLCERFMENINLTYNDILQNMAKVLGGQNPFDSQNDFDQETFDFLNNRKLNENLCFYRDLIDGEMIFGIPIITYIESVVTHCCNEDIIIIDEVEYVSKKIRNSFAHGRWFITRDNSIMMYDADPKNINDYKLEYVGKINIGSFKRWADDFIKQNKNNISVVRGSHR